jgi:hypothetical protein
MINPCDVQGFLSWIQKNKKLSTCGSNTSSDNSAPYPDLNQVALSVALIAMIGLSAVAFIVVSRHFNEHLNQFFSVFRRYPNVLTRLRFITTVIIRSVYLNSW